MKILMLLGSPHKKGTTFTLAEKFKQGAEKAGHQVTMISVSSLNIAPCLGCNVCHGEKASCVHKDDMGVIKPELLKSDVIVFVSPLYYFGFTAQLKAVIDRFYSMNEALRSIEKKAILISAGADKDKWAMDGITNHYRVMCRYLHWNNVGELLALGSAAPDDLESGSYLEKAYQLGSEL